MSKKSKKDKHRDKENYQNHCVPQGYNPNMYPQNFNPNVQNQGYNPNIQMQNQNYSNGYNQGYPQNPQGQNINPNIQSDLSQLMGMLNNIDANQLMGMLSQISSNQQNQGGALPNVDQAYSLLNSLKPFMPPERISMVENVLNNFNPNKK